MSQKHVETEYKYELPDDADVPYLGSLPGVASVADPVTHQLEATYFDTSGLDLLAAGITVRRRSGGDDAGWHVKLPVERSRFEVHEPLGRSTSTVPKSIRQSLQVVTRDEQLRPVATVRTRRTRHRLLDAEAEVLAEVSDDRVTAQGAGDTVPRVWRELEVELGSADPSLLDDAARLLAEHGLEPSSAGSKLRRALGEPSVASSANPSEAGTETGAAVVQAHLAGLVADVRRLDPSVRVDAPDAVHRMRVTTRRLRSALATFRPLFDRDVTEPLRDDLKWFAGLLGDARDAEVLRERLLEQLDEEPVEMVRGQVRGFVEDVYSARYREAHRFCLQNMQSPRYLDMIERLDELTTSPPWADGAEARSVGFLRKRVRHDYRRLSQRVAAVSLAQDEHEKTERYHEVRKAAKRVRYATEPLVGIQGKKAKRLRKAMKQVQSVLGDHQDAAVTRRELHQLSDVAATEQVNAYSLGVVDIRQEQQAAAKRAQFASTWDNVSRKKLRAWLS